MALVPYPVVDSGFRAGPLVPMTGKYRAVFGAGEEISRVGMRERNAKRCDVLSFGWGRSQKLEELLRLCQHID